MKLQFGNLRVGMSTVAAVKTLVLENRAISAVFAFEYKQPPLLQERLKLSPDEKAIVESATILRQRARLPFWEALMLSCFGEQRDVNRLLQEATFHQSHSASLLRISSDEIAAGRLEQLTAQRPTGEYLSFSSKFELNDGIFKHFALLDYHCPENDVNDQLVAQVCRRLFRDGAIILSSGESYHAFGFRVMDEMELRDFLAQSLLFSPIIDGRYVAHQLLEGFCALRLSASHEKPKQPSIKFIFTP